MQEKPKKLKTWAIFGVIILVACVGVSKVVSVNNTVNGKELPIYSVETDETSIVARIASGNDFIVIYTR